MVEIVPPLLKDISNHICILCDNKIKREAVYNMFLSKFASAIATKNILTDSVKHIKPMPLAYYGLNFASSGDGKNTPFMALKDLFQWLEIEYDNYNKIIKEKYIQNEKNRLAPEDVGNKKIIKAIEDEAKLLTKIKTSINGCTPQKMYNIAEQIAQSGYGSLFFYNTEFLKQYKESCGKNNYDKTLDIIYNLYDGEVDFTDTVLTDRNELKNISCSVCFASDFSKLKSDNKLRENFKQYLLDGFARRIYICFDNKAYKRQEHLSVEEIIKEKQCKQYFANEIKKIYDDVKEQSLYNFSQEANELIRDYTIEIDKIIDEKFFNSDFLSVEDEIIKVDLLGSTWKIIKTAFLFHLLTEPSNLIVNKEIVQMSINYYNHFQIYLQNLLTLKNRDELEGIKTWILDNLDLPISLNDELRKRLNVDYRNWNTYKKSSLNCILDCLNEIGVTYELTKKGRMELITFKKGE